MPDTPPQPDTYIYGWDTAPAHLAVLGPDGGSIATYAVVQTDGGSWYVYVEAQYAGYPAVVYGGRVGIPMEITLPTRVGAVASLNSLEILVPEPQPSVRIEEKD